MLENQNTLEKIIDSLTNITFGFDIEAVKKDLVLMEVPKYVLEKLGKDKVQENFNKGVFKIKMPNGRVIDSTSINEFIIENNINEPVIYLNPDITYVQFVVKKNFVRPQIKNHIKRQITCNNDVNFDELKKQILVQELKYKKIEGYINKLPIKTSPHISEGKIYIQSSCSRESAIELLNEVLEELKKDAKAYLKIKYRQDYMYITIYLLFVGFILTLWLINKQSETVNFWLSNFIGIVLFLVPLVVMRLINHSFFDSLLLRKKAEKKYEKEFFSKVN